VRRATVGRLRSRWSASCRNASCWETAARCRLFPDPDAPSMTACARSISTASCAWLRRPSGAHPCVSALARAAAQAGHAQQEYTEQNRDKPSPRSHAFNNDACLPHRRTRCGRGAVAASLWRPRLHERPLANRLRSPRASTLGKVPRRPPGSSSRPAAPPAGVPRGVSGRARGLLQPRTGNEQKSRNARLPLILFFDSGPTFQKGAHGAVPNRGLPSVSPDRW
jgi:hypothetical protein